MDNCPNTTVILTGTWFGHIAGATNRGALTVTLRHDNDNVWGEFVFDDLVLGRTVALIRGQVRKDQIDAKLSEFRGTANQLVPTTGEIHATIRNAGKQIAGEWRTDAGTSGAFLVERDDLGMHTGLLATNQTQTWKTEIHNFQLPAFSLQAKDLKEIVNLFRIAAQQSRERHEAWLRDYWHGQPPPAALAAIPLPTIEIVEGDAFTVTTGLTGLENLEFKPNLRAISFYSYKQGAPVVPSHGLQVQITGINGLAPPLTASGIINVHGLDENWVTGVLQKFKSFFAERRSRRGWLHTAIADQLLNLLVVVPLTLLFLYRSFTLLPDELTQSSILMVGLAIYLLLCISVISQQFLKFARRVYPIYEIQFDPPARFQKGRFLVWTFVGTLFLGVAANFLYAWITAGLTR